MMSGDSRCSWWSVVAVVACVASAVAVGCARAKPIEPTKAVASDYFPEPEQLRLAEAVERGDAEGIAAAVRGGANVDRPGREGMRMLMWAMLKGSVPGYRALLEHDANLLAEYFNPVWMRPGQLRRTVAELTANFSDKAFLHAMLEHGFDPDTIVHQKTRETMLFYMVFRHDLEGVRILLDAGANVNQRDDYGETPLHLSVDLDDYRIANLFLERGADAAICDNGGFTACSGLKYSGSRGVAPEQEPAFEQFVAEMVRRGLITHEEIVEADKPKGDGPGGVTIVEHPADSPLGRAIEVMDRRERALNQGRGR